MEITNLKEELEKMQDDISLKLKELGRIDKEIKREQTAISETADFLSDKMGKNLNKETFIDFFKKPYVIIPQGKSSTLVAVPKFIKDFQVGWLWKETDSYFIYQFDQYSSWLGDAPKELLDQINFKKEIDLQIEGNTIYFAPEYKANIKAKLGRYLKDISENQATITRGNAFDVIAETIESGCLPFKPKPVKKEDLRPAKSDIVLRDYQKQAYKKFLETGAVGVFHPTGAGKSFIALYTMDTIKGKKIIIVPSRTLVEQWAYYIEKHIPHAKDEIKIVTYQGCRDNDEEYDVVFYDECQRLPADTFSRLGVMKTKYRMGLSASPHREDGRESYIFALTGFPIGLNWQEYMTTVGKKYHPINVHVVYSAAGKIKKLEELLNEKKKTFIFCDTIELGKRIANQFGIPYIYGQTINRLEEIQNNRVVVVSRVADLGVSVKDLQRIIEVDFLFGSRQQELQRTGRLLHSDIGEKHDIIMTEAELSSYGKRLWALQEKGFTIKVNQ